MPLGVPPVGRLPDERMTRPSDAVTFLTTFVRARWGYRFKSREALERWQEKKLATFQREVLPRIQRYQSSSGVEFGQIPVTGKAEMLAHFEDFNRDRITLKTALDASLEAEHSRNFEQTMPGGITVGLSSGTSGKRGVFLVSRTERSQWAALILSRVLSSASFMRVLNLFKSPLRIAFFLRANSKLYTTVHSFRIKFHFFDLLDGFEKHISRLQALQPHIVIAPPSVLRRISDAQQAGDCTIQPLQIVSVAEVLEQDDQEAIDKAWPMRLCQVYQCTEGFLAYTCPQGRLHLNEEFVYIEKHWLDDEKRRFQPIITDFTRQTQAFVRYRLDDILHVDPNPCSCGRVSVCLESIDGRQDDVLWLPDTRTGDLKPIFPDVLRRSMLLAQNAFSEYTVVQERSVVYIALDVHGEWAVAQESVLLELGKLWIRHRVTAPQTVFVPWRRHEVHSKRRRIQCKQKMTGKMP